MVLVVSVVSVRPFRFVVSGFSTCPAMAVTFVVDRPISFIVHQQ